MPEKAPVVPICLYGGFGWWMERLVISIGRRAGVFPMAKLAFAEYGHILLVFRPFQIARQEEYQFVIKDEAHTQVLKNHT